MNEIGLANNPEPPDEPFIRCEKCGGEIYGGEDAFVWTEKTTMLICEDCFFDYFDQFSRREKAAMIGVEVRRIEFAGNVYPVKW